MPLGVLGPVRARLAHAVPIHIQGVVLDVELVDLGHHLLDALQTGVAELEELVTVDADEVIVLPVTEGSLELRLVLPELVADDEIALHQELERVVDGGATHAVAALLHAEVELVGIDVVVGCVNFLKYGKAFRRLTLSALPEEGAEDPPDLLQLTGRDGRPLRVFHGADAMRCAVFSVFPQPLPGRRGSAPDSPAE